MSTTPNWEYIVYWTDDQLRDRLLELVRNNCLDDPLTYEEAVALAIDDVYEIILAYYEDHNLPERGDL